MIEKLFPGGTKIKHFLFNGFVGCGSNTCIIKKTEGDNEEECNCLRSMSQDKSRIFKQRLRKILDKNLNDSDL